MATEYDQLKQEVLRTHVADLSKSGAIGETDYLKRGYLDPSGAATPLGEEFLGLLDAGLLTREGTLTDEGNVYLTSHRDSLDADPDVYRKREERGLNQIDKDQGDQGGFFSMLGDFVTQSVPRMAETAYNGFTAPFVETLTTVPRKLYQAATGDEVKLPRTRTPDEQVNAISEHLTGGILASEPLAAGAIYGTERIVAEIQGKTAESYAAKQEWERHNAEIVELKGAEMLDFLTGSDEWLKARAALVEEQGEDAVSKNEEFDRLAGNFILDPSTVATMGAGALIQKGATTAAKVSLGAESLAMKAKALRIGQVAAATERATLEAGTARATAIATTAAERAQAFRSVGNEAQALRYEATAARVNEKAASVLSRIEELAATEAKLAANLDNIGGKAGVAERIVAANQRIAAFRQLPAQAFGTVAETVGARLIQADDFLAEMVEASGLKALQQSYSMIRSLPGMAIGLATGPIGQASAVASQVLASGPLMQSVGNFSKVLGRELLMERGSVPFWRRVANNSTVSKTQRFLAHRMDEFTLGGRVANVGSPVIRATAVTYPMNLAFEVLADPDTNIARAAERAIGPALVFGGGSAGAGAIFKGSKQKMHAIRAADEINFMRNLTPDQSPGYIAMQRGGRRAVSTYAAAFPNLNWDFTHRGASHYDPVTNTAMINPASNNPLRALVGHEVLHYVTIRNQMQPVIHSTLLGDGETPGLLRGTDGALIPEFQKFRDAYNARMDAAGLKRPELERVAEEYFNENTVDHLMEMVDSGEVSRMAGRTQAGRAMRALIQATIPRVPIIRDLFFRTGGVMETGGRYVMGNGLLADGLRELPEARAMMRKLIRQSAGSSALSSGATAVKIDEVPIPIQKGDPVVDSFHAVLETDAAGNPLKDADGNHIALSRAQDEARASAGHVLTEAQERRVAAGYLPKPGEITANGDGSWSGQFMDRPLIDALAAKGILNPKQIRILRNLSTATKTGKGIRFLLTNHPATIKGRGGKVRYASLAATLRETVPVGFSITKQGNITVHLMSVQQLDHNITRRAASKRGKALYDGNTESIKQDIAAMMDLHAAKTKTDAYYQQKYGVKWEEYQQFINTIFGLMTKEQRNVNPMFQADSIKDGGVYRTYRLDRISKATKMDGMPMPFGYTYVKANYLPDGFPTTAESSAGAAGR